MRPPIDRAAIAAAAAPLDVSGDPGDAEAWLRLLRGLYAIGRRDLPLGRLVEGHVDALQIVARYGSAAQRARVRAGCAFGVWNADGGGDRAAFAEGRLSGGKAFASGAGVLSHALVGVDAPEGGRRLLLVDLAEAPPAIDRSWWRVVGMQRSETHLVRWDGARLEADAMIGTPGDYMREPWFGGGALRFAAVQAGGIAAVVDGVRAHLVAQDRAGHPRQGERLADLYLAAQAAADAVGRAAQAWRADDPDATLAHVAAARAAVYDAGERVLALAQAAVGLPAMFVDHPLSETLGDLSVYLRQPGPDAQRLRAGEGVARGLLTPAL